jgi:hypothetical protein
MIRCAIFGALVSLSVASLASAQYGRAEAGSAGRVVLGHLANGATITFVRTESGGWGIEISGDAVSHLAQQKPAQVELYRAENDVRNLAAGYQTVQREAGDVVARAKISNEGKVAFAALDRWKISGDVLSLSRTVTVDGTEEGAGFFSAIQFVTDSRVSWAEADYLAPGLLYGEPHTRATAPGGSAYYNAKFFSIREDYFSAPLFGLSFRNGQWVAVMDMAPHGDTTAVETTAKATTSVIDERLRFGALGTREDPQGGIDFGFRMPGTTREFEGGFGFGPPPPLQSQKSFVGATSRSNPDSRRVIRSAFASVTTSPSLRWSATRGAGLGRP